MTPGEPGRHVGTALPRCTRARGQTAELLTGLTDPQRWLADHGAVTDVLHDCVIGLLRERVGQPGITPRLHRQIQQARIWTAIQNQLGQPSLNPGRIATKVHMSLRSLHQTLRDAGTTPMALVKQLRLEECRRRLADPALSDRTVKDIALSLGYPRPDQFARDFKQMFDVSARTIRPSRQKQIPET